MKKVICLLIVFLSVGVIALRGEIKSFLIHEKVVNRSVEYSIFLANGYYGPMYKSSRAQVELVVYELNGNSKDILWKTMINKGVLSNYPFAGKPIYRKVTLFNLGEHRTNIVAAYKVTYRTGRNSLSYEENCFMEKGNGNKFSIAL